METLGAKEFNKTNQERTLPKNLIALAPKVSALYLHSPGTQHLHSFQVKKQRRGIKEEASKKRHLLLTDGQGPNSEA
jgi:hypothetical protein